MKKRWDVDVMMGKNMPTLFVITLPLDHLT